ncbi:hypothetical protein WJX81_004007 [Elliptochloris bilobata]|uniref:Carboxypeptidase n=1 Tax=Elliptochloris bilobata TaxID=381761 RepID=A0AAW1RQR3_9CHLO
MLYEAQEGTDAESTPIVLWLQGGPGASALLGNMYELGPYLLTEDLALRENPATWNNRFAMLFVEQPVGTGFSEPGSGGLARTMLESTTGLYAGLQAFFAAHPALQRRPFFVAGESYAGKFVPSLGHFVLQMEARHGRARVELAAADALPVPEAAGALGALGAPLFRLVGLAIGNGLTDPHTQVGGH